MRLPCPHCGDRDEREFTWDGDAESLRPRDPQDCSDENWASYLFFVENRREADWERWCHSYGCGLWFYLQRDPVSHRVLAVRRVDGEPELVA